MADNAFLINGAPVASDDVGGVQYPRTKISHGADGSAEDVSAVAPLPTVPMLTAGGNISLTTAAVGTSFTGFGAQGLKQLTIVNNTGTTIEFRQGAAGVAFPIFDKAAFSVYGITNANQIDVRRADGSNTTVVVQARWES